MTETTAPGSTEPLRVAVVGAGSWGEQHARVFAGRPDTELVAVVGRTAERTEARAARYGARAYTDLHRMLEREQPELVAVCLPNEDHYATTLELVRTGIPLFVEKPLVFDLTEADALLAAADRSRSFFAIDFNHRFAEPVVRTRAAIEAGELGEIVSASWRFGGEGPDTGSAVANLVETQCHGFDLLEHLVGPIASVAARASDSVSGSGSTVAVALGFADGAVGTLLGSYDWSYASPDAQRVEVDGTEGRAVIHDTVRELELSVAGDPTTRVWRAGYFDDEARSFHATLDRHVDLVLRALAAGEPPPVHAAAGRRALELADAVLRSVRTGEAVELPM